MTVCVCIASRGRPEELRKTIDGLYSTASLMDTHAAVALDDDDPRASEYGDYVVRRWGIGICAPRERSLGAKYNRAASYARSGTTIYVLGVDDCFISTPGWDKMFVDAAAKFADGVGCIYFGGKDHGQPFQLPDGMAVTKGWIEQVGFFCPELFPYWWHDTWIDEMARFTGRYVWADAQWEKFGKTEQPGAHKTTRMRDVAWWARFFDATRQSRVDKAIEMIRSLDYPEWLRTQLLQEMQAAGRVLWQRNGVVRDNGQKFEANYGAERAEDPGYDQIRAEAKAILA